MNDLTVVDSIYLDAQQKEDVRRCLLYTSMIVPGTLKPGDSKNEDVYTKKHTFKLADVSQNKTLYLENLKATPFVLSLIHI